MIVLTVMGVLALLGAYLVIQVKISFFLADLADRFTGQLWFGALAYFMYIIGVGAGLPLGIAFQYAHGGF